MKTCILILFAFGSTILNSQTYQSRYGNTTSPAGTYRALLVFAQIDYTGCTPDPYEVNAEWPTNEPPVFKDNLLDLEASTSPVNYITKYFYEMSGGRLNVIGDYYTDLITVSCSSLGTWNGTSKVIEQLNSNPSPIETAEGYELSDFDNWTRTAAGTSKVNTSDTKIDMLIIIWRNNRYIDGNLVCAAGYAIQEILGFGTTAIQTMTGADLVGSFNACTEGHAQQIVVSEYFHTLFGGNNWHCGSGAAPYTFLSTTSSFSMAAQASCVSQIACAWDRQHLGYYGWKDDNLTVPKTYLISALNTSRDEVQTNITIQNYPNGGDFISGILLKRVMQSK